MKAKFNHKEEEKKYIKKWEETNLYKTEQISKKDKKKKYILDMFPYPSGTGLHVGHTEGYTATDIYSRFYRMNGFDVIHPMGWDAFGLPAENFAIKTGVHPRKNTDKAIETFKTQMKAVGLSYDWDLEVSTHTKEYYKWTQWLFLLMLKRGLAYKKEAPVNWCESCKTVIANEQVVNGVCERCDSTVVQKNMNQWFLKITDYADRLIEDLDTLDWPDSTKAAQVNWIGRSEGAEIEFKLDGKENIKINIFTTRLDTIYGVSSLIISPEYTGLDSVFPEESKKEIEEYRKKARLKTELERTSLQKDKTGIFTGLNAINPYNGQKIQVWMSDFVISTYGTGAIMAVPAHDERDFAFAKKYNLEIKKVVQPEIVDEDIDVYTDKNGILLNSDEFNGLSVKDAFNKLIEKAEENGFGKRKINYKLRDWSISRQRYWGSPIPVVYSKSGEVIPVKEEDLPVVLPEDIEFLPTGRSPLLDHKEFNYVNEKYGVDCTRECDTMDTFICSSWYYFRFCDPKNDAEFASKEALDNIMPVDFYMGGAEHSVMHLLYARFFNKVLFDAGYVKCKEPFQTLRHQGTILGEDSRKMSKRWGNVVNPTDVVEELGADTLRLYEMFMGPIDQMKPWNNNTIQGVRRFIDRIYNLTEFITDVSTPATDEVESFLHKTIKKVSEDIVEIKYNTAIAKFMEFVNLVYEKKAIKKDQLKTFLIILAPFAPFITEELWSEMNPDSTSSVHKQVWPEYDEYLTTDTKVTIGVQVNGKLRGEINIDLDEPEDSVKAKALADQNVKKWISDQNVSKVIYIKGKIVNIVV